MDFEKQIQTDRESLIQDIMKLVSIDSVETAPDAGMPFGAGAAKALDCFLETAESIGLKTENFDHYAGHADYGDQEETLGILGHVDVVPCSGSWVCDPFKPEIIDGKLYGRGVLDDKGPLLACLHAVKILKEMGVPLSKKIRFISDEILADTITFDNSPCLNETLARLSRKGTAEVLFVDDNGNVYTVRKASTK